MITYQRCEYCDGKIGVTVRGARADIHTRRECSGRPPTYVPRPSTPESKLESYRQVFDRLRADAEQYGMDSLAPWDWPPHVGYGLLSPLMTIREQLQELHWRVLNWAPDGADNALFREIKTLLLSTLNFTAPRTATTTTPERIVIPPRAIALALERLRDVTPYAATLCDPQPGDTPEVSRDRWRVSLWVAEVEG